MPLINLIHEQRAALKRQQGQRRLALGAITGIGVLGTAVFGTFFLQTEALNSEARNLTAKVERLEPILNMIQATQDQYNVLNPRLTTLQDAASITQRWTRILDHISRSCPQKVWLTGLRCSQASEYDPVRIELQGIGPDQQSISELILRLQSCMDLQNVNLKYTQGEQVDEKPLIKFEISGEIVGTAATKPAEPDEKDKKDGKGA